MWHDQYHNGIDFSRESDFHRQIPYSPAGMSLTLTGRPDSEILVHFPDGQYEDRTALISDFLLMPFFFFQYVVRMRIEDRSQGCRQGNVASVGYFCENQFP